MAGIPRLLVEPAAPDILLPMGRLRFKFIVAVLLMLHIAADSQAKGRYLEPADFISQSFEGEAPVVSKLWITRETKAHIEEIMGRKWNSLRVRYWERHGKFAFILDEIGKIHPITVGIIVKEAKIEELKVLIYRESRGWEVRHAFFTDQFKGATIDQSYRLDRKIDGISGATLSVRALTRQARLALYLQQQCSHAK